MGSVQHVRGQETSREFVKQQLDQTTKRVVLFFEIRSSLA